ncbi:12699_t:CDS:2 [Dentiscutata erythropus]|uniref:12699_t:CDS:1 n=1 Tax=Dentiscutata erythropus TaxID=1348616 RepID=A0A9N8VYL4_9GLOM|nr:12699_t:CDS:2 [Dentiscutata erythropus]
MSRPEHQAPPEIYYNDEEARKYTSNTRIQSVQADLTYRALELLNLPENEPAFLLDIGCGSGLSGEILDEEGHMWIGMDISPSMLRDLFLQDVGQGMGFRPGTFDGAISISVLQWLCNADHSSHNPKSRLTRFFSTLYSSLRRGARAVFQFYPENDHQCELIMNAAMRCGFEGGLVIDYPNSKKAKKYFLCLFAGQIPIEDGKPKMPKALGVDGEDEPNTIIYSSQRIQERQRTKGKQRKSIKEKDWVMHKKEVARMKGTKSVPLDSKYTARKRKPKF